MKPSRKKIFTLAAVIVIGIPLLFFCAVWRLGLLPLLLYHPYADNSGPRLILSPAGPGHELPSPSSPAGEAGPDNPGKTTRETAYLSGGVSLPNDWYEGKPLLQQQIETRHISRLQNIALNFEGKLNNLVGAAWSEYTTAQKKDQSIPLLPLARKYISAGSALESQCDGQFYAALKNFEAELRKNSLPLDTTKIARQEYEWGKAARKKQILSTAAELL